MLIPASAVPVAEELSNSGFQLAIPTNKGGFKSQTCKSKQDVWPTSVFAGTYMYMHILFRFKSAVVDNLCIGFSIH